MLFTGFLRSAALCTLLWGVSVCADDQPATAAEPDLARQAAESRLSVYKSPTCGHTVFARVATQAEQYQ